MGRELGNWIEYTKSKLSDQSLPEKEISNFFRGNNVYDSAVALCKNNEKETAKAIISNISRRMLSEEEFRRYFANKKIQDTTP